MEKSHYSAQESRGEYELWIPYYLRRKQIAEKTLTQYVYGTESEKLSSAAQEAVEHGILRTQGKRVRPVLTYLVHDMVGGTSPYIDELAILAELPHRGSLIEDDIDDHASQRDGQPPAFQLYGVQATQEAYSFLYQSPLIILNSLPLPEIDKREMSNEYMRLSKRARDGQSKDVSWGESEYIPSLEEYLVMCEEKCAAFEYAITIGSYFGGATPEQSETLLLAGNKAATAFQLVDDLISLREGSDDYANDITEGKKTVPVIYTLENDKESRLKDILNLHTDDPELLSEAIEILEKNGSIEKTEALIKSLVNETVSLISNEFPVSKYRKILFSIIDYGISRTE